MPYLAHAPMEPLNCLVALGPDRCDIWTGTQFQTVDRANAARAAGLTPEQVAHPHALPRRRLRPAGHARLRLHRRGRARRQGGRRARQDRVDARGRPPRRLLPPDVAFDAQRGARRRRHARRPGSTRSSASRSSKARPFARGTVKDGVDVTSVEGAAEHRLRRAANVAVDLHSPKSPGARALVALGRPHPYRLRGRELHRRAVPTRPARIPTSTAATLLAGHPRHLGVLDLAAQQAGWGTPPPAGRARGIAVHASFGSWCAQVAEVSLQGPARSGCIAWSARSTAAGPINPETIRAQMEGGIVFGLSAALYGQITLKRRARAAEQLPRLPGAAHRTRCRRSRCTSCRAPSRPRASASPARR